jgi:uncharacterized repeat protein (TIGR02543 family)
VKKLTLAFTIALFAAIPAAHAQIRYVAVVETELDARSGASDDLSSAEVSLITTELRREAVKNLPQGKYNVMTSETVQSMGGAVLEECIDENCVIVLGSKIGADYIVRGIVSKFKTLLTLSIEMYETENGTLVASSEAIRSENASDLLMKAAAACADMYKTFAAAQSPAAKAAVTYDITATVNPADGGIVLRNPYKAGYEPGTKVTLTATPEKGYTFTGWAGAGSGKKNRITLTMDKDKAVTANFYKKLELEPKPEPVAKTPKPSAGLAQEPPAQKRYMLAAVGLDAAGAGTILYGYFMERSVRDNIKDDVCEWTKAEKAATQRNVAYTVGTIVLLSGISVHILF